jgi:hypothetical protein
MNRRLWKILMGPLVLVACEDPQELIGIESGDDEEASLSKEQAEGVELVSSDELGATASIRACNAPSEHCPAGDGADSDALEFVEDGHGRGGHLASSPEAVLTQLELADEGIIELDPGARSRLHEQILGIDLMGDDRSPRNLPACPHSNATATTYSTSFGIWGMQYGASAGWKKIGFGPHRPVRAEVTVCGMNGCSSDIQTGTPLDVSVSLMVPLQVAGPVYASAHIVDGTCIAASAFQYWP